MKILKQFLLYFHTLRTLKVRQIFFQVYYGFKKQFLSRSPYQPRDLLEQFIHINPIYLPYNQVIKKSGINDFTILNIHHNFGSIIDWNYLHYGKLWNYHLQYADFLLDENLTINERLLLLESLSDQIIQKKLLLEPYPVSLRLANTFLFLNIHLLDSLVIRHALLIQINFLENNLEFHLDGNHLLENVLALRMSSLFIRNEQKSMDNVRRLRTILKEQINADGSHFERSSMYHCILLDKMLTLLGLMTSEEEDYKDLLHNIQRMVNYLYTITNKGTNYKVLQDSTRNSGMVMKHIFTNLSKLKILPQLTTLSDSGYRILESEHFFAIFNMAFKLPEFQPGHLHADLLSFELDILQEPIFVNPGISTYEKNTRRELERSTRHHNTVCIHDTNQPQLWKGFRMAKRSYCMIHKEHSNSLEASVTYYHHKWVHFRTIESTPDKLKIHDRITEETNDLAVCSFFIDHSLTHKISFASDSKVIIGSCNLEFIGFTKIVIEDYKQALDFNLLVDSKVIRVYFQTNLISTIHV